MSEKAKRFYEVDLLRFIAAFLVLLFHYTFRGHAADNLSDLDYPWLAPIGKYGFLGVDLFFLISGFVILMTATAGTTKQFVISRVTRLYPAYWICCTATWVVSMLSSRGRHVASVGEYLANMTMLNGLLGDRIPFVDSVYWSLLVEMKFYFLVFAVLLVKQIKHVKILLAVWLVASILTLTLHPRFVSFFIIPEFAPYFVAGAMFFLIAKEGLDLFKGAVILVSLATVMWIGVQNIEESHRHYHQDFSPIIICGAQAFFFFVFFLISTGRLRMKESKTFFILGTLTYPLYLLHQNIGFTLFNALVPTLNVHLVLWGVIALMLVVVYFITKAEKAIAKPMKNALTKMLKPTALASTAALFLLSCEPKVEGGGPAQPTPTTAQPTQTGAPVPQQQRAAAPMLPSCAAMYPADWKPITTHDASPVPSLPKPARGVPFLDPTYKTCITRATDHQADGIPDFARSEYSRRQAFNADDTKLLLTAGNGAWWLYDARTFKKLFVAENVGGDAEPQWHGTNPDLFYYNPNNGVGMKLYEFNVQTRKSRVVGEFGPRVKKLWPTAQSCWTHDYGSTSADSRYFAFECADDKWDGLGIFTYDREKDQILATFTLPPKAPQPLPTISPSGKYVIVSWGKEGGATERFTLDFKNKLEVTKSIEHGDIAIDANGVDTYVSVDYNGNGGPIYMVNLDTGKRTDIMTTYAESTATAMHFSGKAFKRPGWVVMSTYADYGGPMQWFHRKVFALELAEKGRTVLLAHHHSGLGGFFAEPHASPNRDFTKLVFNSNWDVKTEHDVDTYMIQIPRSALEP